MLRRVMAGVTSMMAMRMMTLAHLSAVGSGHSQAPPEAWLLPLLGDAVIGLSAIPVAVLLWRRRGLAPWTASVVWNALAAWDSLSAYLVNRAAPWNDFDMLRVFGPSMFFVSAGVNLVLLGVTLSRPGIAQLLGIDQEPLALAVVDEAASSGARH